MGYRYTVLLGISLFFLSAAGGNAPGDATPIPVSQTWQDPYNHDKVFANPGNFRRIGQFYFSAEPEQNSDTYQNEWITLKNFFRINSDLNLRPKEEQYGIANEAQYLNSVLHWWNGSQLPDPKNLIPAPQNRNLNYQEDSVSVIDGYPLDDGGENGPWNFKRAENLLALLVQKGNCPALIHCHAGVGRTGQAQALVAYAIFGVPMDKAIGQLLELSEDRRPNDNQIKFLYAFQAAHPNAGYLWEQTPGECTR